MNMSPCLRTFGLGLFLTCSACASAPADDAPASADELSNRTVRVSAIIEADYRMLVRGLDELELESDDEVCIDGFGCTQLRYTNAEWICDAVNVWARPDTFLSAGQMTEKLLDRNVTVAASAPNVMGDQARSPVVNDMLKLSCQILPDQGERYTVDVPADTPNLEKVDGTSYTVRFDLPDLIVAKSNSKLAPADDAAWVEAGSFTIRFKKLERR